MPPSHPPGADPADTGAPAVTALALAALADSTRRLVRTVDGLDEDALAAPSLLPGWTRSHVVAHLALNAEGMTRALEGIRTGRPETLYASREQRTADIEELADGTRSELRERFLGSAARFADVLAGVPGTLVDEVAEWYPGGMRRPVRDFTAIRRGEVEVHHVDLGADGYDHTDWPGDFCAWLIDNRARAGASDPPVTVFAGDLDRDWDVGTGGGPTVTGPAHALAWWLAGRGDGSGLEAEGPLPRIGAW